MQLARWARVQGEPAQTAETEKMWPQSPKSSQSAEEVGCSLCRKRELASSVSKFSGDDNVAELGAEAGVGEVWIAL